MNAVLMLIRLQNVLKCLHLYFSGFSDYEHVVCNVIEISCSFVNSGATANFRYWFILILLTDTSLTASVI
jgi:hypothetical protein